MYRDALADLNVWFHNKKRKPLVLRGARQVGKSTLVRLFARQQNLVLHEINLERHLYLNDVFRKLDMNLVLAEIEGLTEQIADQNKCLIFLDEIQATPYAIQALRYFFEDFPGLAVISAGSLLEFTLGDHNFSMPVGRISYYHLGPMSFSEFLRVRDKELFDFFTKYRVQDFLADSRHEKFLRYQKEYFYCGGMPEAVSAFIENPQNHDVYNIHKSILETYIDDFSKYAKKTELLRLQQIFRSLPLQAGKKVKFNSLAQNERSSDVKSALELLCKARVCFKVYHSDCSGLPLGAGRKEKIFKLYFLDIGLMNHLNGLTMAYLKKMEPDQLVNEGILAEQFIGQEFSRLFQSDLYYWLREGRSNNAEVDFVIQKESSLIPVEVKSGKSGSLRSLHQFIYHKNETNALRFDLNKPGVQQIEASITNSNQESEKVSYTLHSLPLYLAEKALDYV